MIFGIVGGYVIRFEVLASTVKSIKKDVRTIDRIEKVLCLMAKEIVDDDEALKICIGE